LNTLRGYITDIEVHQQLSLVKVDIKGISLTSVILNDGVYTPKAGEEAKVLFKETEVTIGLDQDLPVSQQNQIPGTISKLEVSKLLSRLSIESTAGTIHAIITTNAVQQLQLQEGLKVKALIKTNELMLGT